MGHLDAPDDLGVAPVIWQAMVHAFANAIEAPINDPTHDASADTPILTRGDSAESWRAEGVRLAAEWQAVVELRLYD